MSYRGFIKRGSKEYNIQLQLVKKEIEHELITLSKYKKHENQWQPYLIDDALGLAYVISKHGNFFRKITGVSYKNSLTEASLD